MSAMLLLLSCPRLNGCRALLRRVEASKRFAGAWPRALHRLVALLIIRTGLGNR
jgi:hypothetical protein